MVAIEKLTKTFAAPNGEQIRAVVDATLRIADGELLVLVGPSGSGKTTILRMIAGLEEPSAGTIAIDGRPVDGVPPHARDISMVFQESSLYPHMTVGQNLGFGLQLRKVKAADIRRRVGEAADLLGLAQLLDRPPKALSGGERQRVALGRAIVLTPRVLLLDEPFSNLDGPLRAQLRRELVRVHQRLRATMIYVTHDQVEAMTLAQRIAVLRGGRIEQTGSPQEIYARPANLFVAGFFGVPPMNCFRGRLVRKERSVFFQCSGPSGETEWGLDPQTLEVAGRASGPDEVVLGLRPEHIRELKTGESCAPEETMLQATVDLVEPLGSETHLCLASEAGPFVARVSAKSRAQPADKICVALRLAEAHWFAAATGERLG